MVITIYWIYKIYLLQIYFILDCNKESSVIIDKMILLYVNRDSCQIHAELSNVSDLDNSVE